MALLGKKTVARKRKNRKIDIIEEHNNLVLYLNIKEIEKERIKPINIVKRAILPQIK